MPRVSYLFERRCHVCTAAHRVGQIFEIIEFEAPLLNTFALKLSAVVIMVPIRNNVILLIAPAISRFKMIISRMVKNTVRGNELAEYSYFYNG